MRSHIKITLAAFLMWTCVNHDEPDPNPIDCDELTIDVPSSSIVQPSGCATTNGSFTITANGGKEPYQYSIDNGVTFKSTSLFDNLGTGNYTATVKDANNCTKEFAVQLKSLTSTLQINGTITTTTSCASATGSINISATGGQQPYQYSKDDGITFSNNSTFETLASGDYKIKVKDATGCTTSANVKITSNVGYSTEIKQIIQTNCAKAGCHDGSSSRTNLTVLSTLQSNASSVKSRVQNGSMPPGAPLSQADKNRIACWVDDGAKDN